MAKYYDEEGYEEPRRPRRSAGNGPAWAMAVLMLIGLMIFGTYVLIDLYPRDGDGNSLIDTVGKQATHAPRSDPAATPVPRNDSLTDTDYNATSQAEYDAAVRTGDTPPTSPSVATPDLGSLPLNSAGVPIIDARQQQQQYQSLLLAEQERIRAMNYAALNATAEAAVAGRAPDVSKEDAEKMMGRDLCHVPRADPHTCEQGLFKPTPVQ